MTTYTAEVLWSRAGQKFVDNCYSRRHVLRFDGGIEVAFSAGSEGAVRRYIEVESRRRADLEFSVRRTADAIVLRVTARADA